MKVEPVASAQGYILVLCGAIQCDTDLHDHALAAMRRAVRSSRLGVLVVSGCSIGHLACQLRSPGPILVLQPSDGSQRPIGTAMRIGPLLADEDVAVAEAWVRGASFDPELLPEHLVSIHRRMRTFVRN